MKKGINIWSFPPAPVRDTLLLAKDAGFEGVELALDATGEISLDSTEKELLDIRAFAENIGLKIPSLSCSMCWDFRLSDDDKAKREKAKDIIRRQMETAKILGADTVLVIPGVVNAVFSNPEVKVPYDTVYERALSGILELKDHAEELEINIGLENVWNKFLLSPMEMRDFIDKIGSDYVGAYLDIGNTLYCSYPEDWVRILGKRIKKVHFKDYRCEAGGLVGFVDLLAGDVDYPEVVRALDEVGYDGWVAAEMIPNYKHYTETIIYNTSNSMDKILRRK